MVITYHPVAAVEPSTAQQNSGYANARMRSIRGEGGGQCPARAPAIQGGHPELSLGQVLAPPPQVLPTLAVSDTAQFVPLLDRQLPGDGFL